MFNHILHSLSSLLSHKLQHNDDTLSVIKQQLFQFNEYIMQQFLKLSVYYQTKLEYQSVEYQEEIMVLKKEIERQYKVIGLMKNQLEDLVVIVNLQRAAGEGEGKEWKVNKEGASKLWQGYNSTDSTNTNSHQCSQGPQSPTAPQPLHHQNTIFGLQVIAQQQTERTLMSVCDEQQMNNNEGQNISEFDENGYKQQCDIEKEKVNEIKNIKQQQSQFIQRRQQFRLREQQQMRRKDAGVQFQDFQTQRNEQIPLYSHQDQPLQQQQPNHMQNQQQLSMVHYRQCVLEEYENQLQQSVQHNKAGKYRNIYYTSQQQEEQSHRSNHYQLQQRYQSKHPSSSVVYSKATNFVYNPFAKSKLRPFQTNQTAQCNQFQDVDKTKQKLQQQRHHHHSSPKIFLQQFRRSFVEDESFQERRQKQQIKRGSEDVMQILEMIAMKGNTEISSRRQKQQIITVKSTKKQHATSSRSRSKIQPQSGHHVSSKKTKTSRKKRVSTQQSYRLQQPQPFECSNSAKKQQSVSEYNNNKNSRLTMSNNNNRCETEGRVSNGNNEECTSTQRYQLDEQNDNIQEHHWASTSISNERSQYRNKSQHYREQNYDQFKSLQTTFGRPEGLKQVKNDYGNRQDQQCVRDDLQKVPRKFSCGGLNGRQLDVRDRSSGIINKENDRQRRMSEKIQTTTKGSVTSTNMLQKKSSAKYIKRSNQITPAQQHSITSMLQSHLQQSNKFLIGSKKQQIKYDGQRMTYGHMTLKHGHGILYYSNGLIYEGEFVENKRQGYGLLRFNHVELYSGEWGNDQLNGKGKIRNCAIINKKKKQASEGYSLQSKQIALSGMNNIFIKWISYCGSFKSNRFEGQGTLYLQGGEKFVGWFKNGVADGQGSLFKKNGEVQSGRWKNNVMVERQSFKNNVYRYETEY